MSPLREEGSWNVEVVLSRSPAHLTPADQDAARSLLQLFYLDRWMGGDGAVAGHPVPEQTQQGVIQLG